MKYQVGSLSIHIKEEYEVQGNKMCQVRIFSDDVELEGLYYQFEDLEIIKDALNEYFDTSQ